MSNSAIDTISLIVQSSLLCIQIPTLIALIVYVIKTWEMASATRESAKIAEQTLQEMRDTRDQEIAPYVIAYFDVKVAEDRIDFVIKNIGKSMATDVQIEFDPPFQAPPGLPDAPTTEELMKKLMPGGKIPSIPPNHEIRTVISGFLDYRDGLPEKYRISVTCHGGISDALRKAEYISDIRMYDGIVFVGKKRN
jgi:hypothetical protein